MKRVFLIVVLILWAVTAQAQAGPFLVCDPQTGVTSYTLTGPAWVPATKAAETNGSLRLDVAASTVGANALTVKACNVDPVWGTQCSAAVPFSFTRPTAPVSPGGIKLSQ